MKEEKSNIEKLREDLKGVAMDVAHSDVAKAAKEKLSEVANSEMAKKAKEALADAANSETAKLAMEKLTEAANSEYAKAAKAKFDAAAKSEMAQKAKGKVAEEFSNAKSWVSVNWHNGRYGKLRVAVACGVVLLAVRGLFCGWGGGSEVAPGGNDHSDDSGDVAAAAFLGALMGGGGSGGGSSSVQSRPVSSKPAGPTIFRWKCRRCGKIVKSPSTPLPEKCGPKRMCEFDLQR